MLRLVAEFHPEVTVHIKLIPNALLPAERVYVLSEALTHIAVADSVYANAVVKII